MLQKPRSEKLKLLDKPTEEEFLQLSAPRIPLGEKLLFSTNMSKLRLTSKSLHLIQVKLNQVKEC